MRPASLTLTAAIAIACAPLSTSAQDLEPTVSAVISHVAEDLDAIRETLRELEDAPEAGRFTMWDKDHYRTNLNEHLDEAFELIAPGFYRDHKAQLNELDEAIEEAQAERSELVIERMSAAPATGGPSLVDRARGREHPQGSREEVEARLEASTAAARDLERQRDALFRAFARGLEERFNIQLTSEQARAALYQVNGSSMIESAIVAEVLVAIEARLREITEQDLEVGVAQRYYGVAAVTRLMIARMHERHLVDYDEVWLPRLDELAAGNRALIDETLRALDETEGEARRAALGNNLEIQRQIGESIARYREVLEGRRDVTREALEAVERDAVVAVNTLKTLESAVRLSAVMTQGLEEFRHLISVNAPALLPLDDQQMFDRFLDISRQIEGTS